MNLRAGRIETIDLLGLCFGYAVQKNSKKPSFNLIAAG